MACAPVGLSRKSKALDGKMGLGVEVLEAGESFERLTECADMIAGS